MRGFYQVVDAVQQYLEANINVNTVRIGNINEVDLQKQTIYPLAQIITGDVSFNQGTLAFAMRVVVMDSVIDVTNDVVSGSNEYGHTDNKMDVLNTTLAVINGLQSQLRLGSMYQSNFQLLGEPSATPFEDEYGNLLSGWVLDVTIQVPNNEIGVCDFQLDYDLSGSLPSEKYMEKLIYDANSNGIVDNSERLGGQLPSYYSISGHGHNAIEINFTPTGSITATDVQNAIQQAAALGYNDSDNEAYLNSKGVISGSSQLDGTTINNLSGSFSGSFVGDGSGLTGVSNYTDADTRRVLATDDVVSGSSQIDVGLTTGTLDASRLTGTITASAIDYDNVYNTPSLFSGSSQVDHNQTTNYDANRHFLQSEIAISQSQIVDLDHYTDADVKNKLNAEDVLSGSLDNRTIDGLTLTNVSASGDFTGTFNGTAVGTVTDVTATAPISSSGGVTPNISLNDSGVTPGVYNFPTVTVDSKGIIQDIADGSVSGGLDLTNVAYINKDNQFQTDQTISGSLYVSSSAADFSKIELYKNGTLRFQVDVDGNVSGSTFTGDGSGLTGITSDVPAGTVSGSIQVDHNQTTNYSASRHFLMSEISITESQISDLTHYTDADVKAKLNAENVLSGSSFDDMTASGSFSGSFQGTFNGNFTGDGSGLTNLTLPSNVAYTDTDNNFSVGQTINGYLNVSGSTGSLLEVSEGETGLTVEGWVSASTYYGDGSNLTNIVVPSGSLTGDDILLANVGGAAYNTVQKMQDVYHSTGLVSGGQIVDLGGGFIEVTAGEGYIRGTNSDVATLEAMAWEAEPSMSLVNNQLNYIYIEYNGGTPQAVATTTQRTDTNTNLLIGNVFRDADELHINVQTSFDVGDHAVKMIKRLQATAPFAKESGGVITEVGTRQLTVSQGVWWEGLKQFTTPALNTSTSDTFIYAYRNGIGGWTEIDGSTTIDNLQYDDGSGTLATLSNSRYGVHWVFIAGDGTLHVLYGQTNGTLTEAEDAVLPSSLPPYYNDYTRLIGKIIVFKASTNLTSIISAFGSTLSGGSGIQSLVDDTTPQLGGNLDVNGYNITMTGTETVDGRDVSVDGATLDSHIADTNIHFSQSQIVITKSQISDADGLISSSAQVDHNATTNYSSSRHFLMSEISITESQISDLVHYTDTDVRDVLNTDGVVSGSSQIVISSTTGKLPVSRVDGAVSSSSQINHDQTSGYDSSEHFTQAQILIDSLQVVDFNIAHKAQMNVHNVVSASLITGDVEGWTFTGGTFSGDGSGLTGVISTPPAGTVSGSIQIDHNQTTNYSASRHFLMSEISITESQISDLNHFTVADLPSGTVSGSSQIEINGTTGQLSGSRIEGDITVNTVSASYIQLDKLSNGTAPAHSEGIIYYDTEQGALTVYNDEVDISLQIGQEFYLRGYNNSGTTITNGTPVYTSGSQGDNAYIWPSQAEVVNGGHTHAHIVGIATHDIENNTVGYVTTQGVVRGIDTTAFAAGDILYVSSSLGELTNVEPQHPYEKIVAGIVIRSHANGIVYVSTKEPIHFDDISGLSGSAAVNKDLWVYDEGNNAWYPTHEGLELTGSLSGSFVGSGVGSFNGVFVGNNAILDGEFSGIHSGSFSGSFVGDGSGLTGISGVGSSISSSLQLDDTSNIAYRDQDNNFLVGQTISGSLLVTGSNGNLFEVTDGTGSLQVAGWVSASVYYGDGSQLSGIQTTLPAGIVSGSSQIDHDSTTNYSADEHFTQAAISIPSSQLTDSSNLAKKDEDNNFSAAQTIHSSGSAVLTVSGSVGNLLQVNDTIGGDVFTVNNSSASALLNVSESGQVDIAGDVYANAYYGDGSNLSGITTSLPAGVVSGSSQINHDLTTGFVVNEHIDWTVSQTSSIHPDNYLTGSSGNYVPIVGNTDITGSISVYDSGSDIFTVSGSTGELLKVTDDVTITSGSLFNVFGSGSEVFSIQDDGSTYTTGQYNLRALNTAPSSASDTGTLGEIRITSTHIYVCTATNTWKRVAIATW